MQGRCRPQKPADTTHYEGGENNESTGLDRGPLYRMEPPGALTLTLGNGLGPGSSSDICHTILSFVHDTAGTLAFFQTPANQTGSHHWSFVLAIVSIWKTSLLASPLIVSSSYTSQCKYHSSQRPSHGFPKKQMLPQALCQLSLFNSPSALSIT